MRFVSPHDQTLAAAFKAAATTFLTVWLIPGKQACKAGTSQGEARLRLVPNRAHTSPRGGGMPDEGGKTQLAFGVTRTAPQGTAVMVQLL